MAIKRPLPPGCYSSFWGERAEKRGTEVYFKYEGYFLTGDMGYIDENGYLKVVGRKEDVITLASGEEIYPSKVEDSIYERKEVAECAVVPFDSKNRGQVPMAFVVLRGCPADEKEMELAKP